MQDVIVIGGGIAGLINSILLSKSGLRVTLIEKKSFPFHRVCGEYISNEVLPFLERHDLFPTSCEPARIDELQLTSTSGNSFLHPLDLGGFGISRYTYDQWLAHKAQEVGVELLENVKVNQVSFTGSGFAVNTTTRSSLASKIVISAHGKRSTLDKSLERPFLQKYSPYVGVKYHVQLDFPDDRIALHNFKGGYCGISKVEEGKVNICYMTHRDQLRKYGNIPELENRVLFKNPFLRKAFSDARFLMEKPEVINEITFEKKEPVFNHLFMSGDAAGSITPLCGNGMALAIHSAKILSDILIENWNNGDFDRVKLEQLYSQQWNQLFARRLWAGRQIQSLFGNNLASELAVFTGKYIKPVARSLIHHTHGQPFS